MTVYSKTMSGRIAAVDQQSGLTAAQKDFLKSVDGKAPVDELFASWRNGPDALRLLQVLEERGLVEVRELRWRNSSANSAFASSFADSAPTAPAPLQAAANARPSLASKRTAKTHSATGLDDIKESMATFVLTHVPHHAVTVLKEIEDIDSYDRLIMMLTAYSNMAHEAGRTGLAHIKSLRAMLEPEFDNTAH